jgi:hypothetical protein
VVTVPAFVWRGGSFRRALTVGLGCGAFFGALAALDSGVLLVGGIVFVLLTAFYGIWMGRRMAKYWPDAEQLSGTQREEVARVARHGERIGDPGLAHAVMTYRQGLHAAVETGRWIRWVLAFVLVVAIGTAVWDAMFGSWGNAVVSCIYLVMLLGELFWWPRRRDQLLSNADRAAEAATQIVETQGPTAH